jgi:hypothetical protein
VKPVAGRFLITAVLILLCGLTLGFYMAIGDDATLVPVHAHLNLVGFVAMSIYGLFYQVMPGADVGRWPLAHFWLSLTAAICLPGGMALIVLDNPAAGEPLSFLGMVAMSSSAILFARAIMQTGRVSRAQGSS